MTGALSIMLGVRETPEYLSREDYVSKLEWISMKYVVLWDEDSKRGWLVNGTTALLHLVRASLEHNKRSKVRRVFLFEEMKDPETPHTADSAMDVLLLQENRALKIYPGKVESWEEPNGNGSADPVPKSKTTFVRLEDRVDHFYHILEKMIEHQIKIESRSGLDMKLRLRKYLEGWEFREVAMRRDPINPVVKTLPTIAKGWVDFTRDIHAITLFGSGFGDLIQPAQPDPLCLAWSQLPPDEYYLAVSVSDLKDIMDLDDNSTRKPLPNVFRVSDTLLWHAPNGLFEPCHCRCAAQADQAVRHSDFVQVLFPARLKAELRSRTSVQLADSLSEAVIFGHSSSFKWWWKDKGDPQRGDPPPEPAELDASPDFYDSGIGSSSGIELSPALTDAGDMGMRPRVVEWVAGGAPAGSSESHSVGIRPREIQPEINGTGGGVGRSRSSLHPKSLVEWVLGRSRQG